MISASRDRGPANGPPGMLLQAPPSSGAKQVHSAAIRPCRCLVYLYLLGREEVQQVALLERAACHTARCTSGDGAAPSTTKTSGGYGGELRSESRSAGSGQQ
ncbi:unnamed protein product [Prorocentrum cordatum]|uniref:Uncharacterized protein n=1 Tax=Prorocentrum cordatum TaxID=2364126 RepID=A0ABN9TGC8_9DINO|nr:unnamed protein product [Polarella glacialis]